MFQCNWNSDDHECEYSYQDEFDEACPGCDDIYFYELYWGVDYDYIDEGYEYDTLGFSDYVDAFFDFMDQLFQSPSLSTFQGTIYETFGPMSPYGANVFNFTPTVSVSSSFGLGPQVNLQTGDTSFQISYGLLEGSVNQDGKYSIGIGPSAPYNLGGLTVSAPLSTDHAFEFSLNARAGAFQFSLQVTDGMGLFYLHDYVERSIHRWISRGY